jgi:hypothetical protein
MAFVFTLPEEAAKFADVLPKRLAKFGLKMNLEKSYLQPCGDKVIEDIAKAKSSFPSMNFVGFRVSWRKAKSGNTGPGLDHVLIGKKRPWPESENTFVDSLIVETT